MNKGFILPKFWYYVISFTWGLPLTLIGCLVSAVLLVAGKRPARSIYGWYFEVSKNWGGCSIGPCTIVGKDWNINMMLHEFGHSIQNCIFGIFMIPFVVIPSVCRYWYYQIDKDISVDYDYAWFEGQATMFGKRYWVANNEKYLE